MVPRPLVPQALSAPTPAQTIVQTMVRRAGPGKALVQTMVHQMPFKTNKKLIVQTIVPEHSPQTAIVQSMVPETTPKSPIGGPCFDHCLFC